MRITDRNNIAYKTIYLTIKGNLLLSLPSTPVISRTARMTRAILQLLKYQPSVKPGVLLRPIPNIVPRYFIASIIVSALKNTQPIFTMSKV